MYQDIAGSVDFGEAEGLPAVDVDSRRLEISQTLPGTG